MSTLIVVITANMARVLGYERRSETADEADYRSSETDAEESDESEADLKLCIDGATYCNYPSLYFSFYGNDTKRAQGCAFLVMKNFAYRTFPWQLHPPTMLDDVCPLNHKPTTVRTMNCYKCVRIVWTELLTQLLIGKKTQKYTYVRKRDGGESFELDHEIVDHDGHSV